jgi:hypothetical protein
MPTGIGSAREPLRDETTREQPNLLHEVPDFSLVLGGPLFQLLRKSHLEGDAMEMLHRRIIAAIAITSFPLLLLSMLGSTFGTAGRLSFFRDIEVQVRLLLALPILIGAELLVHSRLRPMVRRFVEWRIVLPEDIALFRGAVDSATRIRNSVPVELSLVAAVYIFGLWFWGGRNELGLATWYALPGGRWNLTPAG